MDFSYITAEQRESLYNEVWEEPVVTVAKRYGMYDNGLRKHLKRFGIPLPPPGYWSRIAAGQEVSKKPLPEVSGETKKYVWQYVIKYKEDLYIYNYIIFNIHENIHSMLLYRVNRFECT